MTSVKGTRRYDSRSRQAQARRNRETVLDAAERQFLTDGYAATTITTIATEAGVSVETVYKAFGGKAGLIRAIYDRRLAGRRPVSAYQRSDEMRARESDPRTIMHNWGALTGEVAAQLTPIRSLIRCAAATAPDMATLLKDSDDERLERMHHHAQFLADRGYLRGGVTVAQATDILWTCTSAELYELLVAQRGWSLPQFARFVAELMICALLAEPHESALPTSSDERPNT
jgi:AcrR family transcriptional regulator